MFAAWATTRIERFIIGLGKEIARIRKGRNPTAILQLRIPTDVVDVQMGAKYEVDVLGIDACGAQVLKVRTVAHVEHRKMATRLMIASAGVHQNRVMRRAN